MKMERASNGIKTNYTYYPLTQRLDSLLTIYGGNTLSYLQYNYDSVGNILRVNSSYPMPQYQVTERYTYDSADQLLTAESTCNNNLLCSGAYSYNNWGKINTYTQQTTDPATNTSENKDYRYYFPGSSADMAQGQTSFAPIIKYDMHQNPQPLETCTYGINGSIRKRLDNQTQNTDYYYFNTSGNLKACGTDMQISVYGYNSANTRTYKVNLFNANQWVNGQPQPIHPMVLSAMFYPNTYLNFNGNGEYTKHYYNGTERIASRLGDNTTTIALNNNILEACKLQLEEQFREDIHKLIEETVPIDLPPFIDVNALQPTGTPNDIFYYHTNHLGSTAFVTDNNATITQGFLYAPFGEITTEYNANFGNNVLPKYSFNAKELDEETGMYYYEARYYKPPVFTSRDAMFEKYFWMSPYAYCANNPVKYVDPTGKKLKLFDNSFKQQIKEYFIQLFGTSKMFYFNLFNQIKIRKNQFKKVYASMSSDQQKLLDGFRAAIRRKETAIIRVDNNVEKFDFPCYNNVKDDDGNIIETERYLTGFSNLGGGTTSWSDFYSSYLIGVDNAVKDNLTTDEKDIMTGCPAATFVHEALDEFLNYFTAKDVTDNDGKSKRVEYQNTALRILNLPERNGEDHQ